MLRSDSYVHLAAATRIRKSSRRHKAEGEYSLSPFFFWFHHIAHHHPLVFFSVRHAYVLNSSESFCDSSRTGGRWECQYTYPNQTDKRTLFFFYRRKQTGYQPTYLFPLLLRLPHEKVGFFSSPPLSILYVTPTPTPTQPLERPSLRWLADEQMMNERILHPSDRRLATTSR